MIRVPDALLNLFFKFKIEPKFEFSAGVGYAVLQ